VTDDSGLAAEVLDLLAARGETVAVAESITGGLVTSTLVAVPGASAVLRGGVVAYATELKHELLGVDLALLERVGAVDPAVAIAMATGTRDRLGATWAVATTGVAGPEPQDGQPVGTVDLAVAGPNQMISRRLRLTGGRAAIRAAAADAALRLLRDQIAASDPATGTAADDTARSAPRVTPPLGTVKAP
jgi:nicotinamide-nucleotide amidase